MNGERLLCTSSRARIGGHQIKYVDAKQRKTRWFFVGNIAELCDHLLQGSWVISLYTGSSIFRQNSGIKAQRGGQNANTSSVLQEPESGAQTSRGCCLGGSMER